MAHEQGIHALLPQNSNTLGNHRRNVHLDALANMFPFSNVLDPDPNDPEGLADAREAFT